MLDKIIFKAGGTRNKEGHFIAIKDFPGRPSGKEPACQCRRHRNTGSIPGSGRSPREANSNPLQYSCPENPYGQRSLMGYSPWSRKELDPSEWLHFISLVFIFHIQFISRFFQFSTKILSQILLLVCLLPFSASITRNPLTNWSLSL